MDEIKIGSILKAKGGELFMVTKLDDRTIPPLLHLKSLKDGYIFLGTEDDYELFC